MSVESVPQAEHVRIDLDPADVVRAYVQHRRRFASEVAPLDAAALAAPSRCVRWSAADVLRHLIDVEGWMHALWSRQPPPFTSFDPNTTPHEFVVAARSTPDEAIRDRYVISAEEMATYMEGADAQLFGEPSISPLGFVPWWLSVLHIFWDSWLHERDVLLPMGIDVPEERNEVEPVFAYALALAGRLTDGEIDDVVAGVHLATAREGSSAPAILPGGTVSVTPRSPESDVADVIDALAGRGDPDAALARFDGEMAEHLLGLARLFLSAV